MSFDTDRFAIALVSSMPDAVVYSDAERRIRFWNKGAEQIFGFEKAEAVGQSLDIIIPETLRGRHWEGYEKTMRTGTTRYGAGDLLAVPAIRKDGSRISVEFMIVPFHDDAGRMVGIAAIMRDVTKRFEEMKALRTRAAGMPGNPPSA
jgi:PAS domain S-box-containing protein